MQDNTSLEGNIKKMSQKFSEFKNCQIPIVKMLVMGQLRNLARVCQTLMKQNQQPRNSRWRRQIKEILQTCASLEGGLIERISMDIGNSQKLYNSKELKEFDAVEKVVHSVILHELRSSQVRVSIEQYNKIYNQMVNAQDVMVEMKGIVNQTGENINRINQYLDSTYAKVQQAHEELLQARQIQKQTRRMKFRMAISGFFAGIFKLLGLPAIGGLLFGYTVTQ